MFLVSMKRIFHIFTVKSWNKITCTRRQRNPSSLQDCMTSKKSTDFSKPFFVILLLLPSIYYMFYFSADQKYKTMLNERSGDDQKKATDPGEIITDHKNNNPDKVVKVIKAKIKNQSKETKIRLENEHLPLCATGTVFENRTNLTELTRSIEKHYLGMDQKDLTLEVIMGGYYIPSNCRSRHKVAILVPYRNRSDNLKVFLRHIHPFLMRQRFEYRIFVFEQSGKNEFNKGRLFNAGFLEIQKNDDWQCVIFHDVDLLPIDDRIRYSCPILPRHMCASIVGMESIPKYQSVFGGVTALTIWQYKKTNGYSNLYWGRGESEDMFKRLQAADLGVTRYKKNIGRYISLKHQRRPKNPQRPQLLETAVARYKTDGLNTLRYRMLSYATLPLYTHVVIDVDPPNLPDYITETSLTFFI